MLNKQGGVTLWVGEAIVKKKSTQLGIQACGVRRRP
jgi:hypothetical protein